MTTDGAALLAPLIHMNGSSAESLIEGYLAAATLLTKGLEALYACAPNGRDYYPCATQSEPNPFRQASREHDARINSVRQVLAEIEMIVENIQEQQEARTGR